jgi:hypothetical protein
MSRLDRCIRSDVADAELWPTDCQDAGVESAPGSVVADVKPGRTLVKTLLNHPASARLSRMWN